MLRRLLAASVIVVAVAACGGESPTPSPSASLSTSPAPTSPATPSPTVVTPTPRPAFPTSMRAACNGVALRDSPALSGKLVARIASGAKVRVVATKGGDAYTAGACGTSGDSWLKIDKVGSKTAKKLYGMKYVYAAAGLFQ